MPRVISYKEFDLTNDAATFWLSTILVLLVVTAITLGIAAEVFFVQNRFSGAAVPAIMAVPLICFAIYKYHVCRNIVKLYYCQPKRSRRDQYDDPSDD